MRISDWSSDVCSSDLRVRYWSSGSAYVSGCGKTASKKRKTTAPEGRRPGHRRCDVASERRAHRRHADRAVVGNVRLQAGAALLARHGFVRLHEPLLRSEEHTSELQSLMRISYAVFCLKKKTNQQHNKNQKSNKQ